MEILGFTVFLVIFVGLAAGSIATWIGTDKSWIMNCLVATGFVAAAALVSFFAHLSRSETKGPSAETRGAVVGTVLPPFVTRTTATTCSQTFFFQKRVEKVELGYVGDPTVKGCAHLAKRENGEITYYDGNQDLSLQTLSGVQTWEGFSSPLPHWQWSANEPLAHSSAHTVASH